MRRTRAAAAAALLLAGALGLTACGGPEVKAADSSALLSPGVYPAGVSLQVDNPVCTEAGDLFLCSINVWYANGTTDSVTIDASTTVVKDDSGSSYSGIAGGDIKSLAIDAGTRTLVLWSVRIPRPHKPVEIVWVAPDGSVAKAVLPGTASPTPTDSGASTSPSVSVTPSESPTPSETPTASPTPTPSPTKTSASPKPSPTRTRTPSPSATAPTGSIG